MNWLKANWTVLLPIAISIVAAIWAYITSMRQKHLEDNLARSKVAYDIILDKEFMFYEKIDIIYADIIPSILNIINSLTNEYDYEFSERQELIAKGFKVLFKAAPELKRLCLTYEIYLSEDVKEYNYNAVEAIQSFSHFVIDEVQNLASDKIDITKCHEAKSTVLEACSLARFTIVFRLQQVANPK